MLNLGFWFYISMYNLDIVDQEIDNTIQAAIFQLPTKKVNSDTLENFTIGAVNRVF